MTFNSKLTLAIRNFFKKYGKILFIVFIVWLIIFLFNTYLKNIQREPIASNTYDPDNPVIEYGGSVPNNEKEPVKNALDTYLEYCKNKQYENAYNMLTDDCKEYMYENNITNFQEYVDNIFSTYNSYSYNQNYSNVDNKYIYDVTILNSNILATGTTGGYDSYKEKITIVNEDGTKKISNQGYIDNEEIGIEAEDDYLRIKIASKDMSYSRVGYNLEITNKTTRTIVVSDKQASKEVTLNVDGEYRTANNLDIENIILEPGGTQTIQLIFDKYYDSSRDDLEINFNYIRVLENYNENMTIDEQNAAAIRIYSYNIGLK